MYKRINNDIIYTCQAKSKIAQTEIETMITYAIEVPDVKKADLSEWVKTNFPHLMATGIFKMGTKRPLSFQNSNVVDLGQDEAEVILDVEVEWLRMMENIIAAILNLDLKVSGTLKKFNTTKKAFVVDLMHRVGDDLIESETVELLSEILFTINGDNSLSYVPSSLGDTVPMVYLGVSDQQDNWNNINHQSAFALFIDQFENKKGYADIDGGSFIIDLMIKLSNKAIKDNIATVTRQAESLILSK